MTSDDTPSGRWSARVELPTTEVPGQPAGASDTGPESMTISASGTGRSEGRARRLSRRQLHQLARSLTHRDRAIVQSVADYGLLRSTHLQQLHFADHATADSAARICRRVLKRLSTHRLIEPIERRIGGVRAGSEGTVWRLGPSGDRLLRSTDDTASRARRREPSLRFLEHRMLVADVACVLAMAARRSEFELVAVNPEPGNWRMFSGAHGARETLKPDLFVVTAADDFEDHWFIEVDRGTESVPTIIRQCVQYEAYRRSGREQHRSGVFPRVLWLVPDTHRADRVRAALPRSPELDPTLFRVHTYDELLQVVTGGAL